MYVAARTWGMQPSEFWDLTLWEWLTEAEFRRPKAAGDYAGNLTRADVDHLSAVANMTDEEWERYHGAA